MVTSKRRPCAQGLLFEVTIGARNGVPAEQLDVACFPCASQAHITPGLDILAETAFARRRENGIDLRNRQTFNGVVLVHKDNPIKGLTIPQVDAVFSSTRKCGFGKDIKTWGDMGLTGAWKTRDIQLFGRNSVSGTYGYFKKKALCTRPSF